VSDGLLRDLGFGVAGSDELAPRIKQPSQAKAIRLLPLSSAMAVFRRLHQ
jgi:hypothetical protein